MLKIQQLKRTITGKSDYAFLAQESHIYEDAEFDLGDDFKMFTHGLSIDKSRRRVGVAIVLSPIGVKAWKKAGIPRPIYGG